MIGQVRPHAPADPERPFGDAPTLPDIAAVLRHALGAALAPDAGGLLEMCAEDVVFEFPFTPWDDRARLEGRAALADYLGELGAIVALGEMTVPTVHRSDDGETFTLEFSAAVTSRVNGRALVQRYVALVRARDGRIVHYRDYWDPLVAHAATASPETGEGSGAVRGGSAGRG